ncbi:MAG: putative F420-dependent oxidoreductase [Halieaceae bacterium]|jgi:probable F420-dependent oxidoreductase
MALAPVADACFWNAISFSDHVVHPEEISTPYPYTEDGQRRWPAFTDWPDPWVTIGALAATTQQIRFTNNVFVLPMRNPFMAAKAIGTAAVLSHNRVTLTIGVGWSPDEFAIVEQSFTNRGKRTDEMIEILKLLWSGEMVAFDGKYYQFDRLEMNPAPTAPIPIWVGGISDAALRRAARLGDGWLTDLQSSEDIVKSIDKINQYRVEYGRDHLPFDVMATPVDAWTASAFSKLEEKGVTHIMTLPWLFYHGETNDVELKKDGIKRYAEEHFSL